jgi:transcriptional regulator with XRE-family HTH domain
MSTQQQNNTLATHRKKRGLTQAQAALLVGCRKPQKIARYERGLRFPSLPRTARLAAAYNSTVERLFPLLFAEARAEIARNWAQLNRQRERYAPPPTATTMLTLYPGTHKVGMAVFADADLVTARVCTLNAKRVPAGLGQAAKRLTRQLCDTYRPQVLILEQTASPGSRRSRHLPRMTEAVKAVAGARGIPVVAYTPQEVRAALAPHGTRLTHFDIARMLTRLYPALARYAPKAPRRAWDPPPHYTSLFMAVALGVTWIKQQGQTSSSP